MNWFDMCSEVTLHSSLIIAETAGILHSNMFGLLVCLKTTLWCSLIVTLITLILYSLVNWVLVFLEMILSCCLVITLTTTTRKFFTIVGWLLMWPGAGSSQSGKRCDQPVFDNCLTIVTRILLNLSSAIAVSGCSVFFHWYLPLQQFCQVRNVQMESKKANITKNKHPVTMAELLVAHIQPWYRLEDWQRWKSAWAKPVMWYYYCS